MRIAFFGGSFDPPHRGHTAIARAAVERLSLDRVLVAPVAVQPLKDTDTGPDSNGAVPRASFSDRLAMVRLAVEKDPFLIPSSADAPRPDGGPNYTIDTLIEIRRSLAGGDTLFCLIGADAFLSLKRWRHPGELLQVCDFIVAGRPGFSLERIAEGLPPGVQIRGEERRPEWTRLDLGSPDAAQKPEGMSHIFLLPDLEEHISATEIRAALHCNAGTQTILEPAVAEYIRSHGLYR